MLRRGASFFVRRRTRTSRIDWPEYLDDGHLRRRHASTQWNKNKANKRNGHTRKPKHDSQEAGVATATGAVEPFSFSKVKVTCLPGLEEILSGELRVLGLSSKFSSAPSSSSSSSSSQGRRQKPAAKSAKGASDKTGKKSAGRREGLIQLNDVTVEEMYQCHLRLGTASNIFVEIASFGVRALGELERKASNIDWTKWILPPSSQTSSSSGGSHVIVKATAEKSRLMHTGAVSERISKAIAKRLGQLPPPPSQASSSLGSSKEDEEGRQELLIKVQVYRDRLSIWMDTSTTPLHRRGYRQETAKAPLREDIAFAMLYAAGWIPADDSTTTTSRTSRYTSFLDPFCGSGTIAIEAAAARLGLPPGRLRPPPLQGTPFFNAKTWKKAKRQAMANVKDKSTCNVFASDRDKGAIRITDANADRAGVVITSRHAAFSATPWFDNTSRAPSNLLICSNLPFGHRLGWSKGKRKSRRAQSAAATKREPMFQKLLANVNRLFDEKPPAAALFLQSDPTVLFQSGCRTRLEPVLRTMHGGISVTGVFTSTPTGSRMPNEETRR